MRSGLSPLGASLARREGAAHPLGLILAWLNDPDFPIEAAGRLLERSVRANLDG